MDLPLRRLTLFQHGLGYFCRTGPAAAEFTIDVPRRAMDDVLKSLTVVAGTATVRAIAFETPPDRNPIARRRPLELAAETPVSGLIHAFTGRRVEVALGKQQRVIGELVGLEHEANEHLKRAVLAINTADGVELVALAAVQRISLLDRLDRDDLSFALAEHRRDQDRAEARVVLSAESDVELSYAAPAPAWRVSYRVLIEPTGTNQAGSLPDATDDPNLRDILIQGWGLFDNTLDEDLEDVELTLTAGMPVSFRYALHEPNTPDRPLLHDDRRTVADVFEFAAMDHPTVGIPQPAPAAMLAKAAPRAAFASAAAVGASAPVQATGEAHGALFAYVIDEPVSVRRGESAMVPILQIRTSGARELLYNPQKTPCHPSASVRLRNGISVLERGPATVVDSGSYAGEAVVPFTTPGSELVLGFALELGVLVVPVSRQRTETRSIRLRDNSLVFGVVDVFETVYTIESQLSATTLVVVEHPRTWDTELVSVPAEVGATEARFHVSVEAHRSAALTVTEQRAREYTEHVRGLDGLTLHNYLTDRLLDRATFDALSHVITLLARVTSLEAEQARHNDEREGLRARFGDVRSNLGVLDVTRDAQLRDRFVLQLEELENRMAAIDASDVETRTEINRLDDQVAAALSAVGGS